MIGVSLFSSDVTDRLYGDRRDWKEAEYACTGNGVLSIMNPTSMTMDHRLREAVDAFVARVRRDLDAHVQGLTSDLLRIGTENQEYWRSTLERAVTEARQDAERGFKARLEALRNELTREMDVRLVTERAQLQAATNAAVQATQAAAEAAQAAQAQAAQIKAAQAQFALAETLRAQEPPAPPAPASVPMPAFVAPSPVVAAPPVTAAEPVAVPVPPPSTSRPATEPETPRDARVDTLERLLGAVRRIDESTSLTGILEALAEGAAAQTSRVALMLVDGDVLRPWVTHGYAGGHGPYEIVIGSSGLLTATVALKQTSFVKPLIAREITTPSFMHVPVGHTGLVVPLVVGGDVVAVLYADDVGHDEVREDAPVWTEELDLLVRHAAVRLENLTTARTNEAFGS